MTPDILRRGLAAVFVGINPGMQSARVGHNFANPANGFWRLLHESGFTSRRLAPADGRELLKEGLGLTNLVARATPGVADLTKADFAQGRVELARTLARYRPAAVVFVGITCFRAFAERPGVPIPCGELDERLDGARVFVLPNPSGRNAHFSYAEMLAHFRGAAEAIRAPAPATAEATPPAARARRPR